MLRRFSLLHILFLLGLLLVVPPSLAQANTASVDSLNRVDEMGRKQGYWRFLAPATDKPGYTDGALVEEGSYANSKRIGTWRRYWPNG